MGPTWDRDSGYDTRPGGTGVHGRDRLAGYGRDRLAGYGGGRRPSTHLRRARSRRRGRYRRLRGNVSVPVFAGVAALLASVVVVTAAAGVDQSLTAAATLFNGSDNGLLDLFVDPALGCSPWKVPNLADGGGPASALPLDELQASRWAGGRGDPAALVPLNDPMTLDSNGQFNTGKTDAYRSIVDMPPLPAGESPRAYCSDIERIQGTRLQQDVNLLTGNPGPAPAEADNLFTFMAMRLQQSFTNLNCSSYGMRNDVSTTVDAGGVVVAACFLNQVAPVTAGPGNPAAGMTTCPATTPQSSAAATSSLPAVGSAPSASASAQAWRQRHPRRHHWWW